MSKCLQTKFFEFCGTIIFDLDICGMTMSVKVALEFGAHSKPIF